MGKGPVVLMADDDPDDRSLLGDACKEAGLNLHLYFVEDGSLLLDYLFRRNPYAKHENSPRPDLILLDLNMPTDGREALRLIKSDPDFRKIPVVVFTTSSSEEDILLCYELGANAFITKPPTFQGLVEFVKVMNMYWFEMVNLPLRPELEKGPTPPLSGE
jgi:CheY-like chemotaxis protein